MLSKAAKDPDEGAFSWGVSDLFEDLSGKEWIKVLNVGWMLSQHVFEDEHGSIGNVIDFKTQEVLKLVSHVLRNK